MFVRKSLFNVYDTRALFGLCLLVRSHLGQIRHPLHSQAFTIAHIVIGLSLHIHSFIYLRLHGRLILVMVLLLVPLHSQAFTIAHYSNWSLATYPFFYLSKVTLQAYFSKGIEVISSVMCTIAICLSKPPPVWHLGVSCTVLLINDNEPRHLNHLSFRLSV